MDPATLKDSKEKVKAFEKRSLVRPNDRLPLGEIDRLAVEEGLT